MLSNCLKFQFILKKFKLKLTHEIVYAWKTVQNFTLKIMDEWMYILMLYIKIICLR